MQEDKSIQKSLVDQIYDELISNLKGKENFDDELIKKIKELADSGDLKKQVKLQGILKKGGII
jgi:hypothetical protein